MPAQPSVEPYAPLPVSSEPIARTVDSPTYDMETEELIDSSACAPHHERGEALSPFDTSLFFFQVFDLDPFTSVF